MAVASNRLLQSSWDFVARYSALTFPSRHHRSSRTLCGPGGQLHDWLTVARALGRFPTAGGVELLASGTNSSLDVLTNSTPRQLVSCCDTPAHPQDSAHSFDPSSQRSPAASLLTYDFLIPLISPLSPSLLYSANCLMTLVAFTCSHKLVDSHLSAPRGN